MSWFMHPLAPSQLTAPLYGCRQLLSGVARLAGKQQVQLVARTLQA